MSDSKSTEGIEMAGGNFCIICGEENPSFCDVKYRGFTIVEMTHLHMEEL